MQIFFMKVNILLGAVFAVGRYLTCMLFESPLKQFVSLIMKSKC